MRFAERKTGLKNWGDAEFMPRMAAWLEAIDCDRGLNSMARQSLEALACRYAINRLHLEALISDHPEIENIALPRPVVVSGLPRSGTTALARQLCRGTRWLPYWEAIEPFSSLNDVAGRNRRAAAIAARVGKVMPRMRQFHEDRPDSFADDQELQGLAFGSYSLEWHAHVPGWRDRYLTEDQEPVYRYMKRAMQALTFLRGPGRWTIKNPQHMENLGALRSVFPDALLVVSERPRTDVLRSMGRLIDYLDNHMRSSPRPPSYWPHRLDAMRRSYMETRHHFPDRIEIGLGDWQNLPASLAVG